MTISGSPARVASSDRLSRGFVARVGAVLLAASAVFSILDAMTARRVSGDGRLAVVAVSISAALLAVPAWMLPWRRWPRRALLTLLPVALVLLGVGNAVNPDRFAIGIYFVIVAMWVGIAEQPGTMLALAPLFAFAYWLPLDLADLDNQAAMHALPVVVVTSVMAGESLSYVASRLRGAQRALAEGTERRFLAMVRRSSDVTVVVGSDYRVEYASPAALPVLGMDPDSLVGTTIDELVERHVHADDVASAGAFGHIAGSRPGFTGTIELRLIDDAGVRRHVEVTVSNLLDDGDVCGIVLNLRDIGDRKALEAELSHQAFHDPLCGLANRALFDDRLHQALARAERTGHTVALLFCDLDAFKTVNDTLGHQEGDRLLVEVARRLVATVRDGDTVARFGGDEFAVMVEDVGSLEEAVELGTRLLDALRPPVALAGHRLSIGASIGVATSAPRRVRGPELVSNADAAMYVAKERGKGCVVAFEPEMRARATRRFELAGDLWQAVEREQFRLHYQPTIRLATGEVTGFEALLRWEHPTRGLVPPLEFIPAAEESGLIVPIGRWVLQTACRDAQRWRVTHPDVDLAIAVNVSVRQLRDPGVVDDVAAALHSSGLPGEALVLEVTESVLLDDLESVEAQLRQIKSLGARLAVDDFGTGYSSFGYLRRYPFDVIKIDRSFIQDAVGRSDAAAIVRAMVDLGSSLGLQTVAEGVESADQAELLTTMACREAQGFLWSRPVPAEQIDHLLRNRVVAPRS